LTQFDVFVSGRIVRSNATANIPETRYAKSGDVHIAYQVMGSGPFDFLLVVGWISHLDIGHENPRKRARLSGGEI
jgi:hypothetical protein